MHKIKMLGLVLIAVGSEKQKCCFLPRVRWLDDWWCQGLQSPGRASTWRRCEPRPP